MFKNDVISRLLEKKNEAIEHQFKCLNVECNLSNEQFIVCAEYRPPKGDIYKFFLIEKLQSHVSDGQKKYF